MDITSCFMMGPALAHAAASIEMNHHVHAVGDASRYSGYGRNAAGVRELFLEFEF